MSTKEEIQELLRFLSKDAKLPLAVAMSKVRSPPVRRPDEVCPPARSTELYGLTHRVHRPETISTESITKLIPIFGDEKAAKGVLSAAKRVSKKRSAPGGGEEPTSPKACTTHAS